MRKRVTLSFFIFIISLAGAFAQQKADPSIIQKIRQEGLERSKVMDHAFYLTDVNGPRLSNSPGARRSEQWAVNTLKSWGLKNVNLEYWGDFGQGWDIQRCYVAMKAPYYQPLIATPRAWTGSTRGEISSEVALIKYDTTVIKRLEGKLTGKIVIFDTKDTIATTYKPDAVRFTDEELAGIESLPVLKKISPAVTARIKALRARIGELLHEQNVALILTLARGKHGTVFNAASASYEMNAKPAVAELEMSAENYLRIVRLLKAQTKVEMEADIRTTFYKENPKGYNVIAEIPGTDKKLKDEVVMLGAHLDSWHGATGATDNASGCAVMMEAMRIIKALNLNPRRTIQLALWTSEEQGLLGSKGYVANHFGDATTMKLKPEQKNISAYYNLDNGAGKVRGIYLQNNLAVKSIFEEWLKPFHDLGAIAVPNRNTGATDHISFDEVGIPGFQFVQDKLEYFTRTHHTNQDTYERLNEADLKQAATVIAAFVYNTAQLDQKLPRKPLEGAQ